MKRVTRTIALIAVLALMIGCLGTAYAASGAAPQASPTLTGYSVILDPGYHKGELDITFDVTAAGWADSLGVSYIEIHQASNDKLIDTIYGSTENGLKSTGFTYAYTYTYDGATSGVDYYAIVAIYAQIGTTLDGRTLRTRTVTAP